MVIVIPLQATDDELIVIGKENPGFQVEREEDGTVTMSPTRNETSPKCVEAAGQLGFTPSANPMVSALPSNRPMQTSACYIGRIDELWQFEVDLPLGLDGKRRKRVVRARSFADRAPGVY